MEDTLSAFFDALADAVAERVLQRMHGEKETYTVNELADLLLASKNRRRTINIVLRRLFSWISFLRQVLLRFYFAQISAPSDGTRTRNRRFRRRP